MRKNLKSVLLVSILLFVGLSIYLTWDFRKMDFANAFSREGWQVTDRVIKALEIQAGDRIADIGSGNGYFTIRFSKEVGTSGRVYAVDINQKVLDELDEEASNMQISNIETVLGRVDDPLLPDGEIDLVFLCNSFHHIDNRSDYFRRVKDDLSKRGQLVVIDLKPITLVKLMVPKDHWISEETINRDLLNAGYRKSNEWDFLPAQSFQVFTSN